LRLSGAAAALAEPCFVVLLRLLLEPRGVGCGSAERPPPLPLPTLPPLLLLLEEPPVAAATTLDAAWWILE